MTFCGSDEGGFQGENIRKKKLIDSIDRLVL